MNINLWNKSGYSINVTGIRGQLFPPGVKITGELADPKGNKIELVDIDIHLDEVKTVLELIKRVDAKDPLKGLQSPEFLETVIKAVFNALKGAFAVALLGRKKES